MPVQQFNHKHWLDVRYNILQYAQLVIQTQHISFHSPFHFSPSFFNGRRMSYETALGWTLNRYYTETHIYSIVTLRTLYLRPWSSKLHRFPSTSTTSYAIQDLVLFAIVTLSNSFRLSHNSNLSSTSQAISNVDFYFSLEAGFWSITYRETLL